ncbi:GGDEF domain-containing protein [Desulforamulus hydrothermalis]|uniref:Diguanylate cyclase n=1 Tax=Desulforamulus hydrothermalis Lam5 = DSM 18033 TaxID=1121428 RepID=K8E0R9_9FIRM|nr:GGDEF domain-containing protein [Desulforamulus hydrothermalis]CCO09130.1 Diguanylate cyclase [Desulforamulus hydrothermalis Lam5 = DSM 18033]SHH12009.1 diguanylate cyclase (GGDEF) domain-containing protein [Desulforamulus hydrothermalis Lam5 = DSM 18033]
MVDDNILSKFQKLVKLNEKLTQLHWIVAQIAGEHDLRTMYNLILNGFMEIAEVAGCQLLVLDENGAPIANVQRSLANNPFGSCGKLSKILSHMHRIKNTALALPHPICCGHCGSPCQGMLQVLTLDSKYGKPLAIIMAQYEQPPDTAEERHMILELFTIQVSLALENALLNKKFESLSFTDALTGLYNHRYFAERINREVRLNGHVSRHIGLIMLDVDFFKDYNDRFGHPAGDRVLITLGQLFRQAVRPGDIAARYGGEEFAFILPDTGLEECIRLAEHIRQTVAATTFPHRPVTVSLGVAHCPTHTADAGQLPALADKALYAAKAAGRNRVKVAGP